MYLDPTEFDYKKSEIINSYSKNIKFFLQDEKFGKTLEYDLVYFNPNFKGLITDSTSNKEEIFKLMKQYSDGESLDLMIKNLNVSKENERIGKGLTYSRLVWEEEEKKKALIAARYLNSV